MWQFEPFRTGPQAPAGFPQHPSPPGNLLQIEKAVRYGAYVSRAAADVLEKKLQETGMDGLMRDMEMPLSLVLYDMEREGVE